MNLMEKIDHMLLWESEKVDWKGDVMDALKDAQKDIHGEVDVDILKGIIDGIKKKNPKDTGDAIQIGINMLRS